MKVFPAHGLVLCGVGIALLSSALLFAPGFWPVVLAAWLVLLVPCAVDWAWLLRNRGRIEADVHVPPTAIRDDALEGRLRVRSGVRRRVRLRVRPVLPEQLSTVYETRATLEPGWSVEFDIPFTAAKRGVYRFGDVYVRLLGPCAMLQGQARLPGDSMCRVYPDIRRVKEFIVSRRMQHALAPHMRTQRLRGIGSEFESLRDYEEGDDIRRMDWKATARHGKLISRNYEIEHFRDIFIVIDRGRLMAGRVGNGTKLDHAIDGALMIAGVALDGGDRCGLMVFDQDVLAYLPPQGGLGRLQTIVETLFDVEPTLNESHFRRAFVYLQTRLTKRSLVVVLSDVADADASAAMLAGLLSLGRRHLVVLAALRTPEIEGVLAEPLETPEQPYRKAVSYRLLRERADTMARLEKGGVHVLDVRPEHLTIPIVNKYIELREANRL